MAQLGVGWREGKWNATLTHCRRDSRAGLRGGCWKTATGTMGDRGVGMWVSAGLVTDCAVYLCSTLISPERKNEEIDKVTTDETQQ